MAFLHYPSANVEKKGGRTVGRQYQSVIMMIFLSLVMLGGIGSRLFYLQLVEGDRNRKLAEENRILLLPRRPARGTMFDRKGKILAGSRLSHSVSIWPIALPVEQRDQVVKRLAKLLEIPEDEIQQRIESAGYESTQSIAIARGLSPAQTTALAEYASELPGVRVEAEAIRSYPNGDLAAHVIGYTGEIDEEEYDTLADSSQDYRLGDIIGKMGSEKSFESLLRGVWGGQQVEVDSAGNVLSILGEKPPESGQNIRLTIDLELQKVAEKALGDKIGAIVAMDPRDGAILAMVSRPTFDPNIFSTRITQAQWEQLNSRGNPFLNRSLQAYPPASTFKIITTTAGIESGTFPANTVLPTFPNINAGGIVFWDWNNAGFGPLGFDGALQWSSDTFFYQVGMRMGHKPIIKWMRKYGFGAKTGIELVTEESTGLVPDDAWKQEIFEEEWYLGDTINMTIGQGYMQVTPLQTAVMFAVAANGGYRVKPHLLLDGAESQQWKTSLGMRPDTIEVIQRGLRKVVTSGTGTRLNVPTIPNAAGKSGTAEAPPYENHTWFGAYAPFEKPEVLVVAFGEHSGGGGGSFAAPMVKQVMEAYFNGPSEKDKEKSKQPKQSAG
ncbi:penicillin-binding protein 2 [Leptothoe spongobia]|uniref:Penicillin-binding protein 2 n=1 Tax=Leptothoe spongobia TAU-MAC 1115 TaxID=1967444 RepID=A0A947GMW0_9CYAN|nr:penicillin-binding protein 2 [Leptothoe spongobia]MBT9315731.1 penicillin-binding protein 2 [Leptothoe spongobia TAU-MAC 1115]